MTTKATSSNTSNSVSYTTSADNGLSDFSHYKVQAMISESALQCPNRCKRISSKISKRIISICTKIKDRLTPSEYAIEKIKEYAILTACILVTTAITGSALGVLITIALTSIAGSIMCFLLSGPIILGSIILSLSIVTYLLEFRNPHIPHYINPVADNILKKVRSLATALDIPYKKDSDVSMLFHLLQEIQDLSFMSGNSDYDDIRKTLINYLNTNKKCIAPLLKYAEEQDNNKLQKILADINMPKTLSLDKMEECHALLEASTKTYKGDTNTNPIKMALARKLLSDLSSQSTEIINLYDAKRKLIGLITTDTIIETIDQRYKTGMKKSEIQVTYSPIENLIDKLHYTSRLCSLLNSCYLSLDVDSTQKIPKAQCEQLKQCNIIYQNLRCQLLNICSESNKIWYVGAITRQINRSWIERYQHHSAHYEHLSNPVSQENQCPVSLLSFDEIAPAVDMADHIVLFDADNHLYGRDTLLLCALHQTQDIEQEIRLPALRSPSTRTTGNIIDIIPLTKIINVEQFTIENILPVVLPLDFIQQAKAN